MEMTRQETKAKQALLRRIEIEQRARAQVIKLIYDAFRKLMALGYGEDVKAQFFRFSNLKAKNSEQLQKILTDLRLYLYMTATHAAEESAKVVDEEYGLTKAFIASAVIDKEQFGKTAKERISIYTNRFKYEAEMWIAAGRTLELDEKALLDEFRTYMAKPYANPVFREASKMPSSAVRLERGKPFFGIGQYTSAVNSLTRLETALVGQAYKDAQLNAWSGRSDIIGYIVGRGSSYPCQICDDMRGFHTSTLDLPPFHANCKCWCIPVTSTDML